MKAIKVNADYESVLYHKKSLPVVNEALEFLAFFIDDRPLLSHKKYSEEYLSNVEKITGHKPTIKKEGNFENWWGDLQNIELEEKLNSKEMSAKLCIEEGWCNDTYIISSLSDLPDLSNGKIYLAKNPYGMSGQNFCQVSEGRLQNLEVMLKSGKVILEPFFDRVYDFSHYVFPDGRMICYQNVVDHRFQYRGTLFNGGYDLTHLSFYSEISPAEWKEFETALKKIIKHYHHAEISSGFSIDSFVYREDGKLKIRFLSEVNYRKTMGFIAHELTQKLAKESAWTFFTLSKAQNHISLDEEDILLLSPHDVRYDMFFLRAKNAQEGKNLFMKLKKLLPSSEFAIEL